MLTLEGKFPKLMFSHDEGYACCGQMVVFDIQKQAPRYALTNGVWTANPIPGHETQEECFIAFNNEINSASREAAEKFHFPEKEEHEFCHAFVSLTLHETQIPGLLPWLMNNGWKVLQRGRNPKTNNIIYNLGRDFE